MPQKKKTVQPVIEPPVVKEEQPVVYQAVGRRKSAIAQVRLSPGTGQITVNGKPIGEYFGGRMAAATYSAPFQIVQAEGRYDGSVKVVGSGPSGQLTAVVHGISRALLLVNPEWRVPLKRRGLLTRDPRVKEQRKYGNAQKARKKKQSPKR